jgi:uncharacterized protein YlxW (UPF0749 family)
MISTATVKWAAGILVTVLIFVATSLWSASSEASQRAAEIKVLEARVNNLETTVSTITHSTAQISNSVSQLTSQQAAFQARFEAEIANLKTVTDALRDIGHRGHRSSVAPAQ